MERIDVRHYFVESQIVKSNMKKLNVTKDEYLCLFICVFLTNYHYDQLFSFYMVRNKIFYHITNAVNKNMNIDEILLQLRNKEPTSAVGFLEKSHSIFFSDEIVDKFYQLPESYKKIELWVGYKKTFYVYYDEGSFSFNNMKSQLSVFFHSFNPDRELYQQNLISEHEYAKLVEGLNNTASEYTPYHTIISLIEAQVMKTPENIAVCFNRESVSYGELNGRANDLANKIHHERLAKNCLYIPILMQRSIELIISIIAVIKLGKAFVLIDVSWPEERVLSVLKDLDAKLLLSSYTTKVNHKLFGGIIYHVNYRDLKRSNYSFRVTTKPESPLFITYTSGSTGKPKGAINANKGIVNRFLYMNSRYGSSEKDVILLTSNHAFDAAVWQLLWPLINGAKVIIPKHSDTFDFFEIIELVELYQVTITDFVPSVANILTKLLESRTHFAKKLSSLKHLLIGGEAMKADNIYKLKSYLPNCGITNTYGPSECSIGTIFYEVPKNYIPIIPIGHPISNVKVFILDSQKELSPFGSIGELHLGGDCVGLGYVNDKEKTDEVFVSKSFRNECPQRLYATGDLVRYLADGNIEFIGRFDSQIKLNGVRIELLEIEKKIQNLEYVRDVSVLCIKDQLVAFISTYSDFSNYSIDTFRDSLRTRLPISMIPHQVLFLEEMPINQNGKKSRNDLIEIFMRKI